jgi:hypothetical protein
MARREIIRPVGHKPYLGKLDIYDPQAGALIGGRFSHLLSAPPAPH